MRSVILFNMVTIDGFVAGPNGEIDWHRTDDEFNQFAVEQLREVGGLLFGRVTYALMESYWPTPAAEEDDPMVAEEMNRLPKVVFSRSMQSAAWQNTRLVKENAAAEVSRLKEHPGRDLFLSSQSLSLFGSMLVQYAIIWYITLTTQSGPFLTISTLAPSCRRLSSRCFAGVWADRYPRKRLDHRRGCADRVSTLVLAHVLPAWATRSCG
jgi:dihydrofolate reductase